MFPLISDQLNHYPSKALYVRHPNSKPEFVFGLVKPQGSTAGNPTKISPADLLFFNRQILPQSLRPHLNKSQVLGQVGLKELLPPPHRRTSTISSSTRRLNDNEFCSTICKSTKQWSQEPRKQVFWSENFQLTWCPMKRLSCHWAISVRESIDITKGKSNTTAL